MADRSGATMFGYVFNILAEAKKNDGKLADLDKLARSMYGQSMFYDFEDYHMRCDDALVTLGLAKRTHDGEVVYLRDDRFEEVANGDLDSSPNSSNGAVLHVVR